MRPHRNILPARTVAWNLGDAPRHGVRRARFRQGICSGKRRFRNIPPDGKSGSARILRTFCEETHEIKRGSVPRLTTEARYMRQLQKDTPPPGVNSA